VLAMGKSLCRPCSTENGDNAFLCASETLTTLPQPSKSEDALSNLAPSWRCVFCTRDYYVDEEHTLMLPALWIRVRIR
jgi:hypothetical protein